MSRTDLVARIGDRDTLVANVVSCYRGASASALDEGLTWYETAHLLARDLDPERPHAGAGVIAALSPQKSWTDNQILARRAYRDGHASGQIGNATDKADRILAGEPPLDVLGGNKTRSFYRAIANPYDPEAVVIDRHAFDIAVGRPTCDRVRKVLENKGAYEYVADAYRAAADVLGVRPSQVQAVTWVHWRQNKAGVVDRLDEETWDDLDTF